MSSEGAGADVAGATSAPARPLKKAEAVAFAAAAQRVEAGIAEISVGRDRHLKVKKVGASPPEYYELQRIVVELQGVRARLRARLGGPT